MMLKRSFSACRSDINYEGCKADVVRLLQKEISGQILTMRDVKASR